MTIQFKIFRLPSNNNSEEEAALNKFLRSVTQLTVHRDFVATNSHSYTVFTVEYFENGHPQGNSRSKKGKVDYREVLSAEDFTLFAKLREWRKEVAARQAVAVYTIFTNEELAQISIQRPKSNAALQQIPGIGEAKVNKSSQEVLAIVSTTTEQQTKKGTTFS